MNRRLSASAMHILHFVVLAALACWVWRDYRADSTPFLYPALSVSLPIAQQQSGHYNRMLSQEIQRSVDYRWSMNFLLRTISLQKQCDSVLIQLNNPAPFNAALDKSLDNLLDTMKRYTDSLLELMAPLEDKLLRAKVHARDISRENQRVLLAEAMKTNVLQAKQDVLFLQYQRVVGYGGWDYFVPGLQPSVICPRAGETFTTTVFLSAFSPSLELYPRYDKVWINQQPATIQDGTVEYSTTFPKPGAYPLHIRIERRPIFSDSLTIYEKNYTINVQ